MTVRKATFINDQEVKPGDVWVSQKGAKIIIDDIAGEFIWVTVGDDQSERMITVRAFDLWVTETKASVQNA